MDWMPAVVSAIGTVRLILIFSGLLMLLRCIFKLYGLGECHKQYFAISGIIYLLGIMPQTLLLLFINSETANYFLDSGSLCWIQKFACIISVSIHGILFLSSMSVIFSSACTMKKLNALLKRKNIFRLLVAYVTILAISRVFFLKVDNSREFYLDVASKQENSSYTGWTSSPVQNPAQKAQLELLLCESSLTASDMKYFLTVCYLLLFLPLIFVIFFFKVLLPKLQNSTDANRIYHLDSGEGWQHHMWWEQDVDIQKVLSTLITFWYFVVQPIVFAFQKNHFVDFGTHFLLTISVFIPWNNNSLEQKNVQSWV